ncbi:MAG: RnfABCDGE type electron transport complex subunit D [Sphaerochaetaceae bacterium]
MIKVSCSPHFHSKQSTASIMYLVIAALCPSLIWGIISFGMRALLVVAVSIAASVLAEYLLGLVSKENTLSDGTAILTGLLVGMNMSASVPIAIPVIASFFAIAVVKWTFGGLGCNWMNPALGGRVFVFFSFSSAMSKFDLPKQLASLASTVTSATSSASVDAVTTATTLSFAKTAISSGEAIGMNSLQYLESQSYPVTQFALNLSEKLGINAYTIDAFFGNMSGCIGETSSLLLLAGGIFLICKKVITWHIPVVYLASYAILNWIFGGIPYGTGAFSGLLIDPLFRGGLMLGAFFMATDYVTSPITYKGQVIFAFGCGFFTFLFRSFGSLAEAVSLAIILMNIVTPTIDRFVKPRKFGYVKEATK